MSSGQEVGAIFGDGTGPAAALLRSPTVIIASVALWGMNVCLFRLFGIDYVYVLTLDLKKDEEKSQKKKKIKQTTMGGAAHEELSTSEPEVDDLSGLDQRNNSGEIEMSGLSMLAKKTENSEDNNLVNVSLYADPGLSPSSKETKAVVASSNYDITEVKLVGLAVILIFTLYLTSYFWIQVGRGTTIGAIFFFYFLVFVGIAVPLPSTSWIRLACRTIFARMGALVKPRCSCIHGKPKPVPFIDVFFADGMCSMSKVRNEIDRDKQFVVLDVQSSHPTQFILPISFRYFSTWECYGSLQAIILILFLHLFQVSLCQHVSHHSLTLSVLDNVLLCIT